MKSEMNAMGLNHLPPQLTTFIGRKQELAEISRRLIDPHCRLLNIVGQGGIGKTRLALEATAVSVQHFPDGVFFVNLQPIESESFLLTAIADALDIQLSGQASPLAQIQAYLREQQLLLTLDNFEQLIDAAPILPQLLLGTEIKILLTSRETLNLQEEWLYPLSGMDYPHEDKAATDSDHFGAVQLFVERAQQIQPEFSLQHEYDGVLRICQLVEGLPLALELSAVWVKSMNCADIALEIERSQDFLATRLRNVPARHRSLQAVFGQTWQHLNDREQAVFRQLAVFRGGFLRDAASHITGASLPLLSSLVDKSLLRWETDAVGNGRYQIHELLRQYGEEKLWLDKEIAQQTVVQHAHYYTTFLAQRLDDLLGGRQVEAMLEIEAELNNVRRAWQWALDNKKAEMLMQMGMPLVSFFWYQSRFHEARDTFTAAVACLQGNQDLIFAAMLSNQGWFDMVTGDNEKGLQIAERSLDLYLRLDEPPVWGLDTDPRLVMAIVLRHSERVEEAVSLLHAVLEEAERRPNLVNKQCAHRLLAQTYHAMNQLEAADKHVHIACDLAEQQQDL